MAERNCDWAQEPRQAQQDLACSETAAAIPENDDAFTSPLSEENLSPAAPPPRRMRRRQHLSLDLQEDAPPVPEQPPMEESTPPPSHPPFSLPTREWQAEPVERFPEENPPYPDVVYGEGESNGDAEEAPLPNLPESNVVPRYFAPVRQSWAGGGSPRKPRNTALWTGIALFCTVLLLLMAVGVVSLHRPYASFRQMADIVSRSSFAQGIFVDGVHIGGMTRQEAQQALGQSAASAQNLLNITIHIDNYTWTLTNHELPFARNTEQMLDVAYAIGRVGSPETIGAQMTPMQYRYNHLYQTAANYCYFNTQVTYDPARLRELTDYLTASINRDPVDAQVATFDFDSRAFTFTEDRQGARLDGEALYQSLAAALDAKNYNAVITMQSEPVLPAVTRVELMNSFALISSYTTQTTSDANRNNNIDLACRAVSGTVVMPGEKFSFNQTTGQRTAEKGYLPAAAIAGGATVDEVGGGVCQVSSTLFNAAAMADLTIVTRSPHTWPSNYVDKGRDATVNWPNLDFVFRNDRTTPIFIVAYYQQRNCTVELYGATLGAGVDIVLNTQLISTTAPPSDPLYEQNPALPPGTTQEKKKARTGYVVETYKVYRRNGVEYKRELLCTSVYPMIQQVIEWN